MGNETSRRDACSTNYNAAGSRIMNNSDSLKFHTFHGENLQLSKNNTVATRVEGFCKGIAFSHRPVAVNEYVYVKILDIRESWSGNLRIGFTANDPLTFRNKLPKYACPYLTNLPGNWARALADRLAKKRDSVVFFYFKQNGEVHYGVNNEERGVFITEVDTSRKLWAVLDIYGNTVKVEFIDPRMLKRDTPSDNVRSRDAIQTNSNCSSIQKIEQLAHAFPSMKRSSVIYFHEKHGRSVLLKNKATVFRQVGDNGYVFTNRPLNSEEIIIINVSKVRALSGSTFVFGVTSSNPSELDCENLPTDPNDLLDRPEYWVVYPTGYSIADSDFLAFTIRSDGALCFHRKGSDFAAVAFVDNSLPLWFFIELIGSTAELKLDGAYTGLSGDQLNQCIKILEEIPTLTLPDVEDETSEFSDSFSDDSNSDCVICCETTKDCALYRCGHACMCFDCASQLWHSAEPYCPICRERIIDVLRIYK